eukprot:SAG31_NODE_2927_length_4900_cov_42.568314_6_plen_52_part_00
MPRLLTCTFTTVKKNVVRYPLRPYVSHTSRIGGTPRGNGDDPTGLGIELPG